MVTFSPNRVDLPLYQPQTETNEEIRNKPEPVVETPLENPAPVKSEEEQFAELLELIERLTKEQEAKGKIEGNATGESLPIDGSENVRPRLNLVALGVALNPIYKEKYDAWSHCLNMLKLVVGPSAIQFKAIWPTITQASTILGVAITAGVPALLGTITTVGSAFILKNSVQELISNENSTTTFSWLKNKAAATTKLAFSTYGMLVGLGALQPAAVGLLIAAGSLYAYYASSNPQEPAKTTLGWVGQKAVSALKVAACAYGVISGIGYATHLGFLPGVQSSIDYLKLGSLLSFPAVEAGSKALVAASSYIKSIPEFFAGMALIVGSQTISMQLLGGINQKVQQETENMYEAFKCSNTYERLMNIGQEEYHQIITEAMGIPYEALKDVFNSLRQYDNEYPENVAKPIIAKLLIVNKEIEVSLEKYRELFNANNLEELDKHLNQDLKPKLFLKAHLQQCVFNPCHPQMGRISADGKTYYSFLSHMLGKKVEIPLKEVGLEQILAEARQVFIQEDQLLQNEYWRILEMQMLQQQQNQAAQQPAA